MNRTMYKCMTKAMYMGWDLMPSDCMEIIEEVYGKRTKAMKPETLYDKIYRMMQQATDHPDDESIQYTIEYYLS